VVSAGADWIVVDGSTIVEGSTVVDGSTVVEGPMVVVGVSGGGSVVVVDDGAAASVASALVATIPHCPSRGTKSPGCLSRWFSHAEKGSSR
jgi:hypothetical protein